MTIAESGAMAMISEFGEEVIVTSMDNEEPDNPDDPIFIDSSGTEGVSETHKVRLYTTPSKEMLEDYGFEDNTQAIMYTTENIADNGDEVEYEPMGYEWIVDESSTNQIGSGPYLFVYKMVSK